MERMNPKESTGASLLKKALNDAQMNIEGIYTVECRDAEGNLKWKDTIKNLVTTVGKNHMLDNYLEGSAFTQTGPFMGLISSVGYSAIAATDTMSSHSGWTEAGPTNAPNFSENRGSAAFAAASGGSAALSANLTFTMSQAGTVKGCFLVLGSGAVNTKDSTAGTLFSAGLFTGGDKVVANTDVLTVSYSVGL